MNGWMQRILNSKTIGHIRRNHALEHATVHILSRKAREVNIYARSDLRGLLVYGDLPTHEVADAVNEALRRLRDGEMQLAVHPNCGTNLVTAGGLAGLAAVAALGLQGIGRKRTSWWKLLSSLPLAILASTFSLILAQPLGQALQIHVTTESHVGDLRVVNVTRYNQGKLVVHRIKTAA